MAFAGVAQVHLLGVYCAHIRGVHLDGGQSGTIGLAGDAGADIQIPAPFPTVVDAGALAVGITMSHLVELRIHEVSSTPGAVPHLHQANSDGPPFRITVTNDGGTTSADLDMIVQFRHSLVR